MPGQINGRISSEPLGRRQFARLLARAGAAAAALGARAGRAHAFAGRDRLEIAQILYTNAAGGAASSGGPAGAAAASVPRPEALRRMLWEVEKRTSIEVSPDVPLLHLGDVVELHRHPLLYLAGDRAFSPPSDEDLGRLRRHLTMGGMLIIDSAEGRAGGGFDQSVRAMLARLLPSSPLGRLAEDHVLFRSFYLLRVPAGRVLALPYLEAVLIGGRAAIVYSQNDLGGAWARDRYGQWQYDVVPGGEAQREQTFRLGVNLTMYALCLDYKADQVHVPFIMRRRTWQVPLPKITPEPAAPSAPASGSGTPL
jgi:hypothetical protein